MNLPVAREIHLAHLTKRRQVHSRATIRNLIDRRCCRDRLGSTRALAGVASSSLSDPGCHLAFQAGFLSEFCQPSGLPTVTCTKIRVPSSATVACLAPPRSSLLDPLSPLDPQHGISGFSPTAHQWKGVISDSVLRVSSERARSQLQAPKGQASRWLPALRAGQLRRPENRRPQSARHPRHQRLAGPC